MTLRFLVNLLLTAAACFAIASAIAGITAWQVEKVTNSHRTVISERFEWHR